ncbi:MAG: pyridoxal phosphate-dependent aminotransferase [Candidatus Altiarchaeota archaeon]
MVAKRVNAVPFSGIRKFFDLASKIEGAVSLGVGEPDFPTPQPMKEAAISSIRADRKNYTSNYGLIDLRQKISKKLKTENDIDADPEKQILVTTGTSESLDLAFRAMLDPGDEVIVPEPSYVAYKPCVWFAHCTPVPVAMHEEDEFRVSVDEIQKAVTPKTKMIIVASPNNPTGSVLRKSDLEEIADIAVEHDLTVISDELYEYLVYDGLKHYSIGSFNGMEDRTITINGFSKGYAFTGWRLGYSAASDEIIEAMMKVHQYAMLNAPTVSQYAALAFDECSSDVKKMVDEYDKRRRLLVEGLNGLDKVSCIMPRGAFYAFANIKETGLTSEEFCGRVLNECKVVVVPGSTFGDSGEGYVRCSYSVSREKIRTALERMGKLSL